MPCPEWECLSVIRIGFPLLTCVSEGICRSVTGLKMVFVCACEEVVPILSGAASAGGLVQVSGVVLGYRWWQCLCILVCGLLTAS